MQKLYKTTPAVLLVFVAYIAFTNLNNQGALTEVSAAVRQGPPGSAAKGAIHSCRVGRKHLLNEIAQEIKLQVDAGQKTMTDYRNAKITSLLAEIELSENPDKCIGLFKEAVRLHEETEVWAMKCVEQGKVGQEEVYKSQVATLETKIVFLTMLYKQEIEFD